MGRIPVLGRIPEAAGAEQYGLALIPPRAFHVTALDGINTGNLESVAPAYQDEARRYLAGLPETLREQLSEDQLGSTIWGAATQGAVTQGAAKQGAANGRGAGSRAARLRSSSHGVGTGAPDVATHV